jgi:hypothetical protein
MRPFVDASAIKVPQSRQLIKATAVPDERHMNAGSSLGS